MRLPNDPVEWVIVSYIAANLILLLWLVGMVVAAYAVGM